MLTGPKTKATSTLDRRRLTEHSPSLRKIYNRFIYLKRSPNRRILQAREDIVNHPAYPCICIARFLELVYPQPPKKDRDYVDSLNETLSALYAILDCMDAMVRLAESESLARTNRKYTKLKQTDTGVDTAPLL